MLSRAAKHERLAVEELRGAVDTIYRASSKLRADSTATHLAGQLQAAVLIIDNVADKIDSRTTEN